MRKNRHSIILSQLIVLWCLGNITSPVFAAKASATIPHIKAGRTAFVARDGVIRPLHTPGHWSRQSYIHFQRNNQLYRDFGRSQKNDFYRGSNQGNNGNSGYNAGSNQDNSGSEGNQVVNRRGARKYQVNNQYFSRHNAETENKYYVGHKQGNDGNGGYNVGDNQDNSSSTGNQIIN